MLLSAVAKTLELNMAFTLSRGTKTAADSVFVSLEHQGVTGWGEGSPNSRYNETAGSCMQALAEMTDALGERPGPYVHVMAQAFARVEGQYAAKAALDMALMDYLGKSVHTPLHRLLGLDPARIVPTCMTLPIATPEQMAERAATAAARGFRYLKVKLGGPDDRAMIAAVRDVTDLAIRVDANEAWTDRDAALREIRWLADHGVVLVEQPMPDAQLSDVVWLKQYSPLPLMADESLTTAARLPDLRDAYHGVNVKLQKCGGICAARTTIEMARVLGFSVMLGCMVESSLGIAATCQLAPLADYLDLDGHLFMCADPFDGLRLEDGRVLPSAAPGLGVTPNEHILPPSNDDYDALMDTDESMLD